MKVTVRTRKPIDSLTVTDLRTFPVWEWASDEETNDDQDETWVRPVRGGLPPGDGTFIVGVALVASCGKKFNGYAEASYPGTPDEDLSVPVILYKKHRVGLEGRHARDIEITLGLPLGGLFPLYVRTNALVIGAKQPWEFRFRRPEV